jgi:hypothetical protein
MLIPHIPPDRECNVLPHWVLLICGGMRSAGCIRNAIGVIAVSGQVSWLPIMEEMFDLSK